MILLALPLFTLPTLAQNNLLIFQSDFGSKDGAVSAMKGVAMSVSPELKIFDLTHEIPPYNVWEAAYRLVQTVPYWPPGTVFVSVCDPGVGTDRKSVVLRTRSGHLLVSPDNGTLTLVAEALGIDQVYEIDEARHRRANSEQSYTFHGRDVYAYTGAKLAAALVSLEQVGPRLPDVVVEIAYQKPEFQNGIISGNIPILDVQYGNVWTSIPKALFDRLNVKPGEQILVEIYQGNNRHFQGDVPYTQTFGEVGIGKELAYFNSLLYFSLALNQDNFAQKYHIESGPSWHIKIKKP
ncbi:SAM hydrolase/SAM-dependent halogenase family protein [Arundinibacter roseus]|nr:S-adenosyl-l-methionine hydroxide adenosyltransferase family protein [Arundinibacter roseus]